ncbi:hypothetical protein JM658_06445 [Joostella atrarenae]|uniref:Uncharacterized protein n=1 Tax=Joostella atrarenae TaxID=679257 RepID=A0ABS9J227_9FLAO|nr:hypothetical protein [Joostella atrarenae]MCF8714468.1 hypothetical protein [Joostella atrarenae]
MKRINLLLFTLIIILQSCNNDDNCDQDCFTPPNTFLFEVLDKTSGENLFTNETYNPEDIIITDSLNDNQSVAYTFISEDNLNLIQIGSIGWETEIVNLNINISEDHIFDLYVDVERKSENCCSFSQYNEIRVSNSELDTQTGIYKILVE